MRATCSRSSLACSLKMRLPYVSRLSGLTPSHPVRRRTVGQSSGIRVALSALFGYNVSRVTRPTMQQHPGANGHRTTARGEEPPQ